MWPVQVGYNTESNLWLKHVMRLQTECQTGIINTSRYYFDLCAVHFASDLTLCLRVMTIIPQMKRSRRGEFRSAWLSFVKFMFDLFFQNNF